MFGQHGLSEIFNFGKEEEDDEEEKEEEEEDNGESQLDHRTHINQLMQSSQDYKREYNCPTSLSDGYHHRNEV